MISSILKEEFGSKNEKGYYPKCNANVNFCNQLNKYYEITKTFVYNVGGHIKEDDLKAFANKLSNILNIPKHSSTEDILDFISYFIWNASFNHSIDHFTLYMAYQYKPYIPDFQTVLNANIPETVTFLNDKINKFIDPITLEEDLLHSISGIGYERGVNLGEFYTKYISSKDGSINYSMKNLDYQFPNNDLKYHQDTFMNILLDYETYLLEAGELLCPLKMISPSISF